LDEAPPPQQQKTLKIHHKRDWGDSITSLISQGGVSESATNSLSLSLVFEFDLQVGFLFIRFLVSSVL